MTRSGEYFNADDSTNPGWNIFPDDNADVAERDDARAMLAWLRSPVIRAVLAEIARQDAADYPTSSDLLDYQIRIAAQAIRNALREVARLNAPPPTRNDGGTTDGN